MNNNYIIFDNGINIMSIGFNKIDDDEEISINIKEYNIKNEKATEKYSFFIPQENIFYYYFYELLSNLKFLIVLNEDNYNNGSSYLQVSEVLNGIRINIIKDLDFGSYKDINIASVNITSNSPHFYIFKNLYNNLNGINRKR